MHIVEGISAAIKRVCRSTVAAESNGVLAGVEAVEYLRMLVAEMDDVRFDIHWEPHHFGRRTFAFTDAGSLQEALAKQTGQSADRRVRILLAQIREYIAQPDDEDCVVSLEWIDTMMMLADALTKTEKVDVAPLQRAMCTNEWTPLASEAAVEAKAMIREGRHRRAGMRRAATSEG